jgi:hypothetical protein
VTTMNATHTARLVVDLTPEQKTRLKLVAVARNTTVMDLLRALIDTELSKYEGLALAGEAAAALAKKVRRG